MSEFTKSIFLSFVQEKFVQQNILKRMLQKDIYLNSYISLIILEEFAF